MDVNIKGFTVAPRTCMLALVKYILVSFEAEPKPAVVELSSTADCTYVFVGFSSTVALRKRYFIRETQYIYEHFRPQLGLD